MVRILTLLSILTLFVLAGCGGPGGSFSKQASKGKENTFRYPIVTSPTTLDPHKVEDGDTIDLLQQVFEGLVGWDENNQVVGKLAEKWDVKDNGQTYVFTLREGAKFHNGRAVTAEDVKWSYERATNPKLASTVAPTYLSDIVGVADKLAGKAAEVSGIKVVDEKTIEIHITRPIPFFLPKLTYLVGAVLPKESVPPDSEITSTEQMVGTGPFKPMRYAVDQLFELTANADYWGGAPKIEKIERPVIKDAATRLLKFKNGELDLVMLERQDVPALEKDPKFKSDLKFFDRPAIWYVGFAPNSYEPFKNPLVRKAFAMAIDRDTIVGELLGGINKPAKSILPPAVPGYREVTQALPYDPAGAKQLLTSAGFADPSKMPALELNFRDSRPDIKIVAEAIQAQLKKNLGVNVTLKSMEWGAYLRKRDEGKLEIFHMRWAADYLDAENFLTIMLTTHGPENKMGYSNAAVDKLCAEADIMPDGPARNAKYQQAEDLLLQDAPWLPLYFQRDAELISSRVKGIKESAFGHLPHVSLSLGD
ncbi:MAG: peptide ABC transporter substrate-binding protein [Armatimonadetes bacterium]|nr:peptide ABC transporter substrate-binding protein [Armatimonadota bacterium]